MKAKFESALTYFSGNIDLNKIPFISFLFWVTVIKISISALLVLVIEFMEIGSLWAYSDFDYYSSGSKTGPNFLYSIFIDIIKAESISNPILIILSCVSSGLIDTLCIYFYSAKYRITRQVVIMYLIFCLHPYFSFYTFRFDTIFFGKIACLIFIGKLFLREKINSELSNFFILLLSMFRLSNLAFLFASLLSDNRLLKLKLTKAFVFSSLIFLISAVVIFSLNTGYSELVLSTPKTYLWTIADMKNLFGTYGLAIDNLILYTLKSLVLFGGREAVYIYQFEYFGRSSYPNLEYCAFFVLALFNLVCLSSFVLLAKRNRFLFPIFLSLALLLLSILTVAHMRYLVVFYPMLLIGWISLGQKKQRLVAETHVS